MSQIDPSPKDPAIAWLMRGDAAIGWQTMRDLLDAKPGAVESERKRVATSGWGRRLLQLQDSCGTWGGGLYTPKWISTTYTLLLLRSFGLMPRNPQALKACQLLVDKGFYRDGGINLVASLRYSETCITGMSLSFAAYFRLDDERLARVAEHLLSQQMPDGGWNCCRPRGATHGSFHTTISVLEGLREFECSHPSTITCMREAQDRGREFLLRHFLFRSHRTGQVVNPAMTRFSFPPRWHYDILRGLDYFRECGAPRDDRLRPAIEIVEHRRGRDGRWVLQNRYPGRTYFELETIGKPSRWNTLRALRVLRWWQSPAGSATCRRTQHRPPAAHHSG